MASAAGQKALPTIAFKHTTAAATVASVSAPILLDIGRDLSPSPPRPAAGDADCHVASLLAMTRGRCHCKPVVTPVAIRVPRQKGGTLQLPPGAHTPAKSVIANQCAHWCGNPRPRRRAWQVSCCLGKFVVLFVFAQSVPFRFVVLQGVRIATSLRSSQ